MARSQYRTPLAAGGPAVLALSTVSATPTRQAQPPRGRTARLWSGRVSPATRNTPPCTRGRRGPSIARDRWAPRRPPARPP
eukprot:7121526-Alexandrium_andersonii.AAC.1